MRAAWAMSLMASCALAGSVLRILPAASDDGAASRSDRASHFRINVGDLRGRLVRVAGCPFPIGVATIPGYLSGLDYEVVEWSRGPAVKRFWFGSRPLTPGWARVAAVAGQALSVAGKAVGVPSWLPSYAVVTFEPTSCERGSDTRLDRAVLEAATL